MPGSFRIARINGIQIRLHFTFLLVLPLIAFGFGRAFAVYQATAVQAGVPHNMVRGSPYVWGSVLAIALFASVLVHELAHAFYAMRKGAKVRDITLLMIGGVSNIAEPPREPKDEAIMALAGPVTSLVLSAACYAVFAILATTTFFSLRFAVFYLASLNLILGLFNLLPAFPMDGGRILRGLLAGKMGNVRATQLAATMGKVFAVLFAVASFLTLNFFLLMIGFFVYLGAEAEASQVVAKSMLGEVRVQDLLQPSPPPLDATATVRDAADSAMRERQLAFPVTRNGELLGIVSVDDVAKVPPERRDSIAVSALLREAPAVSPSSNVWDAMRLMSERDLPFVPVMEGADLLGVVSREDIVRTLRLFRLQRRARPGWAIPRHRMA